MSTNPDVHDAHASLLGAAAAGDRLASRARWARRYFAIFAIASPALVLAVGLGGQGAVLPATIGWMAVVSSLTVWAQRQGVVGKASGRLHGLAWGAWGLLWAATVIVGNNLYPGVAAFWVLAAVIVAAPLVVAAVVAGRTASPR